MKRHQIRGRFTDWRDVSENRMYEYALQLAEWSTLKSGCVEYFVDRYTRVIEDDISHDKEKDNARIDIVDDSFDKYSIFGVISVCDIKHECFLYKEERNDEGCE